MSTPEPRLTSLSHGAGCGCKIAPRVLSEKFCWGDVLLLKLRMEKYI